MKIELACEQRLKGYQEAIAKKPRYCGPDSKPEAQQWLYFEKNKSKYPEKIMRITQFQRKMIEQSEYDITLYLIRTWFRTFSQKLFILKQ